MCVYSCCLISKKFYDKISLLCSKLPPPTIPPTDQAPITPPPLLLSFSPSTEEEVRIVIMSSSDSVTLLVILSLLHLVSPNLVWMYSSNPSSWCLSLSEGSFPNTFKHALVKPLLKKHNLPQEELSSYCPISNLNFVSKVLERIIHARISSYSHNITFGVISINYSLLICIPAVSFHWNCPSPYPKWMTFFLQSINKVQLGTSQYVCRFW